MKKILTASLILASLGLLVSCGPGKAKSEMGVEKVDLKFAQEWNNDQPVKDGEVYKLGMVVTSPFKGILSPIHSDTADDGVILGMISEEIFWQDDNFQRADVEGGMASYHIDVDNKQVIIKFKEGLKWSDGEPLGVDDLIYTYEAVANKDYTGSRFDPTELGKIVGLTDYHEGKANSISGLEKVSDTELRMHLTEVSSNLTVNGGALSLAGMLLPKHYLKDVAMKDLETTDKLRTKTISNGKFVISKIVPGESVEFVPNEYYYQGKQPVSKVILKTLTPQLAVEALKQGEYHEIIGLPQDSYEKYKDLSNLAILGRPALNYSYLGFNLGHRDNEKGINIQDRDTPLQDVRVRQAVGYALNLQEIADAYYHGLRVRANGVIPPIFSAFYDSTLEGYDYNPEKAKELLKEAGYTDTNGDGIVDKDGKNLTLRLGMAGGSDVAEPITKALQQYWAAVGIDVQLTNGRLLDYNVLFEKMAANPDDMDIFAAGWSVGTSLNFNGTYSETGSFNFMRFVDKKNDELLNAINDPKGLTDLEYKANAYKEWQKYMISQAPIIPFMFKYDVSPVNKSVKRSTVYIASEKSNSQVAVVAQPEIAK